MRDNRSAIDWRDGTGDPLDLGDGVTATFLSPMNEKSAREWTGDDGSAVLHVESEPTGRAALLTGDIEDAAEEVAFEYGDRIGNVDWFDVPHHGQAGLVPELLEEADPELNVIPHGRATDGNAIFPRIRGIGRLNRYTDAGTLSPGHFGAVSSRLTAGGVTTEVARSQRQRYDGGRVMFGLCGDGRDDLLAECDKLSDGVGRLEAGARPTEEWQVGGRLGSDEDERRQQDPPQYRAGTGGGETRDDGPAETREERQTDTSRTASAPTVSTRRLLPDQETLIRRYMLRVDPSDDIPLTEWQSGARSHEGGERRDRTAGRGPAKQEIENVGHVGGTANGENGENAESAEEADDGTVEVEQGDGIGL